MAITLHQGDCRSVLAGMPERSVQMCVSSPPYYGLRSYLDASDPNKRREIGIEPIPDCLAWARREPPCGVCYVCTMREVFGLVSRVLRDDGVIFLNLGDSYSGSWGNYAPGGIKGQQRKKSEDGQRWDRRAYGDTTFRPPTSRPMDGLKEKDLMMIPARVALALQADGLYLRSDIVWSKPNCMPESVTDRPTRSHEYLFMFAKSPRYFYDADAIKEPIADGTMARPARLRGELGGVKASHPEHPHGSLRTQPVDPAGRNRRTVWTVATAPYPGSHYAVFPEKLIEPCILAGSSPRACEHCGAPWERHYELGDLVSSGPNKLAIKPRSVHRRPDAEPLEDRAIDGYGDLPRRERRELGWRPTCDHDNTGAGRCVVLDPFAGTATTCRVAEKYGRDSIGIDLGYQELQEQRTNGVQIHMEALL